MSRIDWRGADQPNPDPAGYNPERELRYAVTKKKRDGVRSTPSTKPKSKRGATGPRQNLAEVLRGAPPGGPSKLGKRIDIIQRSGKPDANAFIHKTALLALEHAERTGDCTAALRFINALPKGARQKRLALWFSKHSPIRYLSPDRIRIARQGQRAFKRFDIEGAKRDPFS